MYFSISKTFEKGKKLVLADFLSFGFKRCASFLFKELKLQGRLMVSALPYLLLKGSADAYSKKE
jgi:hypothetical protein